MKRLVGISIGGLQRFYGDKRALEIAADVGADSVDFSVEFDFNDYRKKTHFIQKAKML